MSSRGTHQTAAAVNYALAQHLEALGGDALRWVPTLIFYTAVQVLDARLADAALHPGSQGDRVALTRVYSTSHFGPSAYKELKQLSEDWRYRGEPPDPGQIASAWRWAKDLADTLGEKWPPG